MRANLGSELCLYLLIEVEVGVCLNQAILTDFK
jgi:hypothetical protein